MRRGRLPGHGPDGGIPGVDTSIERNGYLTAQQPTATITATGLPKHTHAMLDVMYDSGNMAGPTGDTDTLRLAFAGEVYDEVFPLGTGGWYDNLGVIAEHAGDVATATLSLLDAEEGDAAHGWLPSICLWTPKVSVQTVSGYATAKEPAHPHSSPEAYGRFRVTRDDTTLHNVLCEPLEVTLAVGGTATPGEDYVLTTGGATLAVSGGSVTVTIRANHQSADVWVDTLHDGIGEPDEPVRLVVVPGETYDPAAGPARRTAEVVILANGT